MPGVGETIPGAPCLKSFPRVRKQIISMTASSTVRHRTRPIAGLRARLAPALAGAALLSLTACGSGADKQAAPPPPQVGYVTVSESSVPLTIELPARTSAYEMSDVRPQVSGIIRKRYFTEGALVK